MTRSPSDSCCAIKVLQLRTATAAIKSIPEKNIKWEEVKERLLEESTTLLTDKGHCDRASPASVMSSNATSGFGIGCKSNHETRDCLLNSLNPENTLNLLTEVADKLTGNNVIDKRTRKRKANADQLSHLQ